MSQKELKHLCLLLNHNGATFILYVYQNFFGVLITIEMAVCCKHTLQSHLLKKNISNLAPAAMYRSFILKTNIS